MPGSTSFPSPRGQACHCLWSGLKFRQALLVTAGVSIGLLVTPPAAPRPDPRAPPVVLIVGEKLDPSADRVMEKALDAVRKYAAGNITLEFPGGGSREVSHLSSRKMVPEVEGDRVDVYATLARIDEAFAKGEASVEAAGERVKPNVPRPSSLRWSCDGAR